MWEIGDQLKWCPGRGQRGCPFDGAVKRGWPLCDACVEEHVMERRGGSVNREGIGMTPRIGELSLTDTPHLQALGGLVHETQRGTVYQMYQFVDLPDESPRGCGVARAETA